MRLAKLTAQAIRHIDLACALALLGASACFALSPLCDPRWPAWLAGIVFAMMACGAGLHARGQERHRKQEIQRYLESQHSFGAEIAPVWSRQIESSRGQMEDAVTALSGRFAGIVAKLEQALIPQRKHESADAQTQDAGQLYAHSQRQLEAVRVRECAQGRRGALHQNRSQGKRLGSPEWVHQV